MNPSGTTRRQFVGQATFAALGLLAQKGLPRQTAAPPCEVLVQTPLGSLRGECAGGVRNFRGIPFAEPPVGDLRFRAPVPRKPWPGVRDATRFPAAAVQSGDRAVPQSEDCLYLNVWTPATGTGSEPLLVFVWIHGGGFTGGESFAPIFDGTKFARQGIVVVTVAYRLGVLGFLDVEPLLGAEFAGSANNALRDLIMALEWVKTNIEAFGGDPERVTLGGESAGAKLTDILMGVPAAEPLFQSMVSESGGAERIWAKTISENVAVGFGRQWTGPSSGSGSNGSGAERSLADLKSAPARALIEAQTQFLDTWPQHFPLRCEIDGLLIPALPVQTIAAGSAKGKRLLIGSNRDESALFIGSHPKQDPTAGDLGNLSLATFDEVYARYAEVYPELSDEQRRIRALTAEEYWVPSLRVADAALRSAARVWMYELEFARSGGPYKGEAFHSEDLALVWDKPSGLFESAAQESTLASQMNAAWAMFVRGETPSAPGLPVWPEYSQRSRPTMLLDATSRVEDKPQEAELRLWKGVL